MVKGKRKTKQMKYIVMINLHRKKKKKKQSFCQGKQNVHIRDINFGDVFRERKERE